MNLKYYDSMIKSKKMNPHIIRRITIKKIQLLIDKKIGDINRLEQIQMKLARGLPLLTENQAYLDVLVTKNISNEEIQKIIQKIESTPLEKSELHECNVFHCICCGNATRKTDGQGMCINCYLDYNIKISKFITKPTGRGF